MLLVNPQTRVIWRFPTARDLRTGVHLNFNDDGFVAAGGRAIVANEEEAHTIVSINIKTHRRRHLFGRPGVRGGGAHLLNTPDDAYPLPNGEVAVADAYNCRVIWIHAHRIVRQLGETGVCAHDPPRTFGAINGDTPLRDGGMLISEINGHWVDEIGPGGKLRWAVQAPVHYPSDPQMLSRGRILLADYSTPGQIVIMNRYGRILWRYGPSAGAGALDHLNGVLLQQPRDAPGEGLDNPLAPDADAGIVDLRLVDLDPELVGVADLGDIVRDGFDQPEVRHSTRAADSPWRGGPG